MADTKTDQTDYVSPKEVAKQLCVTPETLMTWARKGTFPKPIELGHRSHRWKRAVVESFLNQKQLEAKMAK
jgi:predicted DNA-binding transcriptional regulator AlpA